MGFVCQRQTYAKDQVHVGECAVEIPVVVILVARFVIPHRHGIFIGLAHIGGITIIERTKKGEVYNG